MKYFGRDRALDLLNFIAWQMVLGTIPFVILPLVHDFPATQWTVSYVATGLYASVVAMAIGFLLWIEILRWLPAGTASLNMFAVPVLALLASMAIFGERLTRFEWMGIACIGGGLAVLALASWRAPAPAAAGLAPPTGEGG